MNFTSLVRELVGDRLLKFVVAGSLAMAMAPAGRAGLAVPYPLDSSTLHLWHCDETTGTNLYDATTNSQTFPITMTLTPGVDNLPVGTPTQFAKLGVGPAFSSLGSCIMTTQYSIFISPFLSEAPGGPVTNLTSLETNVAITPIYTNLSFVANTNTGAFTYELLIKPSANPIAPPNNEELVCGDSGQAARGFQFRITTSGQLEYNDISSPGSDFKASLPTSGPDLATTNLWYHVALTFTGTNVPYGGVSNVLTMYWTALQPNRTNCDVLATFTKTNNPNGMPVLAFGGSERGNPYNNVANGEGFRGLIDEVRISDVCRTPGQMAFNTNAVDTTPYFALEPPASTLVGYGKTLTLPTSIVGSSPLQITWTQNGVVLPGQTNASLVISNVTFAANGNYECFATNNTKTYGVVGTNSTIAVVTVGAAFDGLFNTGVDANGNPLDKTAPGSYDLHYSLIQSPDPATINDQVFVWGDQSPVSPNGGYAPNGAAVWIGPEENAGSVAGTYEYQTTFLVDQGTPASSSLSGALFSSGSSSVRVLLNGVETDYTLPGNPSAIATDFTLTTANGLQAGSNTLDFIETTTGGGTGFQLALSGIGQALPTNPPTISSQPSSGTVQYGSTAGLAVVALGRPPLLYQWYSNGVAISTASLPSAGSYFLTFGATNYNVADLDTNGNFDVNYQVVISNNSGSVTSSVATLTIAGLAPNVSQTPAVGTNTMILYAGANPAFSVLPAGGVLPDYYEWVSNGVVVAGITNEVFGATNVQIGALSSIDCLVSNLVTVVTNLWDISVIADPTAPFAQAVLAGKPVGYWRLNEADDNLGDGNPGGICNDYVGGHDGIYTNTALGQSGYDTTTDPNETAAYFGYYYGTVNSFAGRIEGVDFAAPTNHSPTFTIQAWVNGSPSTQVNGAGIVAKGYGGGEQFDLDLYANAYRFFVRDAGGGVHGPTSTLKTDGNWHLLVGVCDEVNSNVSLYVDGALAGSSPVVPGSGILESPQSMSIGARMSGTNTAYSYQFAGSMNDVAVYNYAMNAAQVRSLFYAQGIPATVVNQPTNTTCGQYGTATFTATINGTPVVGCQWFDNSGPLPGQTNTTLVLTDVPSSANSDSYYLQVANAYGTNVSQTVGVSVIAGAPEIYVNPTAQLFAPVGGTVSLSVTAYGDEPLSYQWQVSDTNAVSWTNLVNNGRIAGAQSNMLTIADVEPSDEGSYQVIVSNGSGPVTSSAAVLTVGTIPISFNGAGLGWTGKQSGSYANTPVAFNNGILTLTDGINSEARSEFFGQPQYVGAFEASFTYQYAAGSTTVPADGAAFVLQNDPRGASATGAGGGDLGVGGAITPSIELELNLYPSATGGSGYSVNTNGVIGPNKQMGPLVLTSGDPINVTVSYANGQPLSLSFTDAVAGTSFSTNINVGNLTNVVGGSTAYVGFTGGTGGDNSVQTITGFSFVSLALQTLQFTATNTVTVTWPGGIEGYVLQQNSNLATTNWVNVTNPVNVVNGQNEVVVPVNGTNAFYRLSLEP